MPPIVGNRPEHFALNSDIELPADLIAIVRHGRKALEERRAAAERKRIAKEEQERREDEAREKRVGEVVAAFRHYLLAFVIRDSSVHPYIVWNEEKLRAALRDDRTGLQAQVVEIRVPGFHPIVLDVAFNGTGVTLGNVWDLRTTRVCRDGASAKRGEGTVCETIFEALALARELFLADRLAELSA